MNDKLKNTSIEGVGGRRFVLYPEVQSHEQLSTLHPHAQSLSLIFLLLFSFFHLSSFSLFLSPLFPPPSLSSSSSTPHRAPTTSNPIMSRPCSYVCVCVCVGKSLCVFLPAAKIQQLKWPLNLSTNKKPKKVTLKVKSGCCPTAGFLYWLPFNLRVD